MGTETSEASERRAAPQTDPHRDDTVTVVVRRRVKAGKKDAYEAWLKRLVAEAGALPGFIGAEIQKPAAAGRDYVSVFRFNNLAHLEAFERSELRARYLKEVQPLVDGDAVWERFTGLEFWFEPPAGTVIPQPSPFRMALLLIAIVYLLVLSIGSLVALILGDLAYPIRLFITITIEVFLMTYLVMPRATRALARWIYPSTTSTRGRSPA